MTSADVRLRRVLPILMLLLASPPPPLSPARTVAANDLPADGTVRWVDRNSKTVWINRGSADRLLKRTRFGIFSADAAPKFLKKDRKGTIEVTRIIAEHLAEARILSEDADRPIIRGDRIHSAAGVAQRPEKFAFVGRIDPDGDGKSDRQLLHDVINSAGGKIISEVDDTGKRTGGPLTAETKFLVIGTLPELNQIEDPEQQAIARKILEHASAMRVEARMAGVRVVRLRDFTGYGSKKKMRPSDLARYKLRSGAQTAAVNETIGDRSSTGPVSRIFTGRRGQEQEASRGQTSKSNRSGGN